MRGMLRPCQGWGSSTRRFIMSKRSQLYLISAWRLERRRIGLSCLFSTAAIEPLKNSFKLKCAPPHPSPPHGAHFGMNVSSVCTRQRWGERGCYGFVFIRSVNRAEPGTVMTASPCDSLKKKFQRISKARNGGECDVFIVASFLLNLVRTKCTVFLEASLICRIWPQIFTQICFFSPPLLLFLVHTSPSVWLHHFFF